MVPWSLRIQIFPNIRRVELNVKKAWELNLQTSSLKMMQILHDQYESDIKELYKEILKWQEDHGNMTLYTGFMDKDKKLKDYLTKYATNLIKMKENKFTRDKKAYDYEQAYKWTQQGTQSRYRGHYNLGPQATNLDLIESDTSSLSSASYNPIGTCFDGAGNASKKRKNEGENGSQISPKRHMPQIKIREHAHNAHKIT